MAIEFTDVMDIISPESGVFGFLSSPSNTTCTDADTWYPITGAFSNKFIGDFSFDTDHILYSGSLDREFEIDGHVATKGDGNNITVHFGVFLNGSIEAGSVIGTFMKVAGEAFNTSGTSVVSLETGDEIQLVVMSDVAGAEITMEHLTVTIRPFLR